jgi:hypothetical protein
MEVEQAVYHYMGHYREISHKQSMCKCFHPIERGLCAKTRGLKKSPRTSRLSSHFLEIAAVFLTEQEYSQSTFILIEVNKSTA